MMPEPTVEQSRAARKVALLARLKELDSELTAFRTRAAAFRSRNMAFVGGTLAFVASDPNFRESLEVRWRELCGEGDLIKRERDHTLSEWSQLP